MTGKLLIVYDPKGWLQPDPELARHVKSVEISVAEQDAADIYTLAKKLAEMLLEQL